MAWVVPALAAGGSAAVVAGTLLIEADWFHPHAMRLGGALGIQGGGALAPGSSSMSPGVGSSASGSAAMGGIGNDMHLAPDSSVMHPPNNRPAVKAPQPYDRWAAIEEDRERNRVARRLAPRFAAGMGFTPFGGLLGQFRYNRSRAVQRRKSRGMFGNRYVNWRRQNRAARGVNRLFNRGTYNIRRRAARNSFMGRNVGGAAFRALAGRSIASRMAAGYSARQAMRDYGVSYGYATY